MKEIFYGVLKKFVTNPPSYRALCLLGCKFKYHVSNDLKDNNTKVKQINQKLSQVDASAGKLEQLTRELKRAEHDLKSTEGTVDIPKLKQEIDQLAKDKLELDAKISQLSSEMNRLHLQSSAQAQIDVLKKDKGSKDENIRRLKAKQEDTISYLLGHMPTTNIRTQIDDYIGETLRKKEEDLKTLEEKIFSVCGSQNFDDGLLTFKDKMSQTQDTRGSLLGAEHFFKKYATDLEKDDPCCPLCHREFDTDQEVKELVIELKNKLRMVPAKLQKAEKDLDEFRKKYDSMMQLKPLKENISTLTSKEIPELKTKLKKLHEDIGTLRTTIEEKEDDLQTKEGDEDMAKQVQPDVVQIDRYQGEVIELDKKITSQQSTLSGGSSDRTLQDVIDEKEDHQMKVDTITKNLDRKRQKINDHSEELARLKSQINTLKEEKLQIDSDLQQRYKLEEDKATLLSESDQIQREIQNQIDKKKSEKETITAEKEDKIEQAKSQVDMLKNDASKVKNVNQEIKSYINQGKAETLGEIRKKKEQVETKTEKKETEKKEANQNITKIQNDLATQQTRERELLDNLQLRKKTKEIDDVQQKIADLKEQLGDIDVTHLDRERKRLQTQQEELMKEKHHAEGRQRGFEDQIRNIKSELKSDMYKGAPQKFRDKMIVLRTTELAITDLEKYYKALDTAIMRYHSLKMEEINKIIRELWRNTYRGNALAETFCLNCGILALDEPTTNLDRENIESLAFALVEIIKGRVHQKNFQLVIITHDEDFVELLGRSEYVDEFFKVRKDQSGYSQLVRARVHDDNITKRNVLIEQFADKYQFGGFSGCEITDEKYRSFIENVRNKLDTMVTEGKNLKVDFEEKEKKVQLKIDELKENKTKLEQSEHIKRNMMRTYRLPSCSVVIEYGSDGNVNVCMLSSVKLVQHRLVISTEFAVKNIVTRSMISDWWAISVCIVSIVSPV
ncbi:RAD50 [Mytilus edulis]|uniref:RAD50 n=1 Tax=Mytilus edulis TaxID=6550 RepID=A0A8S3QA45_MYTED|nr:RAD50 [Mytilus edulis]